MAVKPALYYILVQEVSDREQAHALVMSHPAAHHFETAKAGAAAALGIEVNRFAKSISPESPFTLQLPQIP